jgi:hypothetical protein
MHCIAHVRLVAKIDTPFPDKWLIDWLFVLRPNQEYFTDMETSPLPVKGCKI